MELRGRVAVVTGASAGIGRATALALAREGAITVVAARRLERLKEVSREIEGRGGTALPLTCDVGVRSEVEGLAARVRDAYGRCDVLVNNAGIPGAGGFEQVSFEQIDLVTRVNYLGVLYCTRAFLPLMLERAGGHVVNIASLAGRYSTPGASLYTAAKHAVVAFSEAVYYELAPRGILVTSVNPAFVATEVFPQLYKPSAFLMPPERVARVVVEVVRRGLAPEVSVPRWAGPFQAFRVLTPPVYRWGVRKAAAMGIRPTPGRRSGPRSGGEAV